MDGACLRTYLPTGASSSMAIKTFIHDALVPFSTCMCTHTCMLIAGDFLGPCLGTYRQEGDMRTAFQAPPGRRC